MKNRDVGDIAGGILLTAIGVFVGLHASTYDFGTAGRMGPGYFPTVLGWTLAVLGLLVAIPAWWRVGVRPTVEWKNWAYVIGSIVLFALTLKPLGIVLSTILAVLVASLADKQITWLGRVYLCIGVAAVTVLIFITGLGMILPMWWWSN